MLAHATRLALLVLALGTATAAPLADEGAAAFEQELARVQRKMELGKWKSARVQLQGALEAHANQAYVLGSLGEIELALSRCLFWESRPNVDMASHFKGELLSHSPSSGMIKLRYKTRMASSLKFKKRDFEPSGVGQVHKLEFSGPYSVTLESTNIPDFWVCVNDGNQIGFSFTSKYSSSCSVRTTLIDKEGNRVRDTIHESFARKDGPREVKVSVTENKVKATIDGKQLLTIKKPKGLFGRFGVQERPEGTITIEGDASHWLQRKRDEIFQDEWGDFEKYWDLARHLPDWMNAALSSSKVGATPSSTGKKPSELSEELVAIWNDSVQAMDAGDHETAITKSRELLEHEPDLVEAAVLQAQAWIGLRNKDEAMRVLAPFAARFPGHPEAIALFARLQLVSGLFEDVQRTVQAAVAAGIPAADLQQISITAGKGLYGPPWAKKYEYTSRHYQVASDLSRDVCRSVALELESSYRYISGRMGMGKHDESRKFQVFVFAGRASYNDYVEDVFEGSGESTQGMYSPWLKQLLVLDSEPRDSLMHTVRHEGFHQFIDPILEEPPIWLNEGLAEYFAASRTPRGTWQAGRLNDRSMQELGGRRAKKRLPPLEKFMKLDRAAFMADGSRCYAQAWAFVHFLEHSSVQNRSRLDRMIEALREGKSQAEAIEHAFGDVELRELDRALAAHIKSLD